MQVALVRTYQPMVIDNVAHPLGLLALDAYLRERGHDRPHLFDMRLKKESPDELLARVLPLRPELIGLSALTIELDTVHALAARIKARAPGCKVVVGGPYATSSRRTVLRDPNVDFVVAGEGEETFHELLLALGAGSALSSVRGLLYREGGAIHETPARPLEPELDKLPLPSWDRVDFAAYDAYDSIDRLTGRRWAAIATSRGCPFLCTYCHDIFGKKFRARSPEKVLEELQLLIERHGVEEFHFFDDIFNFDKGRVLAICDGIVRRGWRVHLQFPNGLRADMMDGELLRALRAAGTFRVSYAIESASPRIQKQVKKRLRIEKVQRLIEETDALGILAHGFFMLGFPGETLAEVTGTIEWALASRLHTAGFFLVSPFEGSPLAAEYTAPAEALHGGDFHYYDNPHSLSEVPAARLRNLQREAYLRFYASPRRIARLVQLLPDPRVLPKFARFFGRVLAGRLKIRGADPRSFDHRPERVPGPGGAAVVLDPPVDAAPFVALRRSSS